MTNSIQLLGADYEPATAIGCALASRLVYSTCKNIRDEATKIHGFDRVEIKTGFLGGTRFMILSDADDILIVFRGSLSPVQANPFGAYHGTLNWLTNLGAVKLRWQHGAVHAGILLVVRRWRGYLASRIRRHQDGTKRVWITGHSLGGGLALVSSQALDAPSHGISVECVYTYGQPRVGNPAYCRRLERQFAGRVTRIVNGSGIVPRVPPGVMGYDHNRKFFLYGANGKVRRCQGSQAVARAKARGLLADHGMDRYLRRAQFNFNRKP